MQGALRALVKHSFIGKQNESKDVSKLGNGRGRMESEEEVLPNTNSKKKTPT